MIVPATVGLATVMPERQRHQSRRNVSSPDVYRAIVITYGYPEIAVNARLGAVSAAASAPAASVATGIMITASK